MEASKLWTVFSGWNLWKFFLLFFLLPRHISAVLCGMTWECYITAFFLHQTSRRWKEKKKGKTFRLANETNELIYIIMNFFQHLAAFASVDIAIYSQTLAFLTLFCLSFRFGDYFTLQTMIILIIFLKLKRILVNFLMAITKVTSITFTTMFYVICIIGHFSSY